MAMTSSAQFRSLVRFSLTTASAESLAEFYVRAFGCRRISETRLRGAAFRRLMGIESDAKCIALSLGADIIELVQFDVAGEPYPVSTASSDLIFQHFALVTNDMTEAWFDLLRTDGWHPITVGNPQHLPESAGGVTAFKFRDPDGHPLELLSFPLQHTPLKWRYRNSNRHCLGIDHSAIAIGNPQVSIDFYSSHGLRKETHSRNSGREQDNLDGLTEATVDVTRLSADISPPNVELLSYKKRATAAPLLLKSNDVAATRLVFEGDVAVPGRLTDPDGHHLIIIPRQELPRPA